MNEQAREVLDFWFGPTDSDAFGKPREVWFKKDDAFDRALRDRDAPLWEQARTGALSDWDASPRELLAFIIVCDQFPRNMFRGDARSFATDPLALDAARRMLGRGWDEQLLSVEKAFAYLPFEHSEDLADQDRSVALFGGDPNDAVLNGYADYAIKHRDFIVRFGRFPHRNVMLGRASTPEEIDFLKQPGSSF
ncbi:MAG: DUF924 family protein [Burkholderiales bacterium]